MCSGSRLLCLIVSSDSIEVDSLICFIDVDGNLIAEDGGNLLDGFLRGLWEATFVSTCGIFADKEA